MAAASNKAFDFEDWTETNGINPDIISSLCDLGLNTKEALISIPEERIKSIAPKMGSRRKFITALNELRIEEQSSFSSNKWETRLESANGSPKIYVLQPKLFKKSDEGDSSDEGKKVRQYTLGNVNDYVKHKVLLIVGETGSGKTTLINGITNYILGVEWKDDSRYKLIAENQESHQGNQAISQTTFVSAYTLHHEDGFRVPYSITLVDTPGFGDTGGIEKDKQITQQIKNFFSTKGDEGIDHIDAVCFVVNSSLSRLTTAQNYVFHQILNLFGKDIEENIFLMLTFADGKTPQVLSSIKEAGIVQNAHFKFNNSALFSAPKGNDGGADEMDFDHMFWKMGMASFKKFFAKIENVPPKSLYLTRTVLDERDRLTTNVENIQLSIRKGLNKLEELRRECEIVKQLDAELMQTKDHTFTVEEEHVEKKDIEKGQYITNCIKCNRTCHRACRIVKDEDKHKCAAMNTEGYCTSCPDNCHWKQHANFPYEFIFTKVKSTKTVQDLYERYEIAGKGKAAKEELVESLEDEFLAVQYQVMGMADKVRRSLERLEEIALRPNPMSTIDYITFMIENEKAEAKAGFHERVKHLEGVKKQLEYMIDIHKGDFHPFQLQIEEKVKAEETGKRKNSPWKTAKRLFVGLVDGVKSGVKSYLTS